jgi:multicomponent Na+:H+ antiporter subunit G
MSAATVAEIVLLALGVAAMWLAAFGMLRLPDALARLHCVSLAGAAGGICFTAAILIDRGVGQLGLKTVMIALLTLLGGAVYVHATGRGLRYRRQFRSGTR